MYYIMILMCWQLPNKHLIRIETSWIYCKGCVYRGKCANDQVKGEWVLKVKSIAVTTRRWVLPFVPAPIWLYRQKLDRAYADLSENRV